MMKIMNSALMVASVIMCSLVGNAWAGISLGQTRLVYLQSSAAQSITLHNSGNDVYLVQAVVTDWVNNQPVSAFSVLPPLFRLEGKRDNVLRVVRTGGDLPMDRESVFHFRVNAIPGNKDTSGEKQGDGASLSVSLGMGIKLFYRPDGLKIRPEQAYRQLTFTHRGRDVVINNPTPYYLTFANLSLGGKAVVTDGALSMLAPFTGGHYVSTALKGEKANWTLITDYGGESDEFHATIQ